MLAEHPIRERYSADNEAFGSLVHQYAGRMKSVGYSVLGDVHLAEDVVQETFLRAFSNISVLNEDSNVGGWLYTIAYRVSIDCRRKGKNEVLPFESMRPLPGDESPEAEVVRNEARETLWNAVDSFDEAYRLPLLLFYKHDWPLQKIADYLCLSVPAVKSRLHRSKKALRAKLEPLEI